MDILWQQALQQHATTITRNDDAWLRDHWQLYAILLLVHISWVLLMADSAHLDFTLRTSATFVTPTHLLGAFPTKDPRKDWCIRQPKDWCIGQHRTHTHQSFHFLWLITHRYQGLCTRCFGKPQAFRCQGHLWLCPLLLPTGRRQYTTASQIRSPMWRGCET